MPKTQPLTPEQLEKVAKLRGGGKSAIPVDDYHLLIAEFGMFYGYEGIKAILNNEIDSETMAWLIVAGRKVKSSEQLRMAEAVLAGTAPIHAKNPQSTFSKLTRRMIKNSKADE